MKDAEDIDIAVVFDEVCDSVMPLEQYAHAARRDGVARPDLGESLEILRPVVDTLNGACGSLWVICGNVFKDVSKPALSLVGPAYFCHDRMRRPISSFEMARFASESVSPRATMA